MFKVVQPDTTMLIQTNAKIDWDGFKGRLEKFYDSMIDGKMNELTLLCDLDESQRKRLKIAATGASQRATNKMIETVSEVYQRGMMDLIGNPALLEELIAHPNQTIFSHPFWNKTLAKVLSESQLATVKKRQEDRVRFFKSVSARQLVQTFLERYIEPEEFQPLCDMLVNQLPPGDIGAVSLAREIYQVEDEHWKAVLSDASSKRVLRMVHRGRTIHDALTEGK